MITPQLKAEIKNSKIIEFISKRFFTITSKVVILQQFTLCILLCIFWPVTKPEKSTQVRGFRDGTFSSSRPQGGFRLNINFFRLAKRRQFLNFKFGREERYQMCYISFSSATLKPACLKSFQKKGSREATTLFCFASGNVCQGCPG